jgi:chromosome segregation ATPase
VAVENPALAQAQNSGRLFCWKNKAGKTECGDKVPYEYQDSGIKEMNRQGVVTSRSESLTPEERKARDAAEEKRAAEAQRKREQARRDKALLDTFSNEKEVDLKRNRDVQLIETNIETLQGNLKNMAERQADARARADQFAKNKRPVPLPIQDEIDRINSDIAQTGRQIAQMRRDIVSLNQRYDEMKKRLAELTGGASIAPSPPPQKSPAAK